MTGDCSQDCRKRGHHDGAEPHQTGTQDRLLRRQSLGALDLQCEIDHQDRVLLDDADQQDHADQRDDAELEAPAASAISAPVPAEGKVERMVSG